ncbi:hypothetical protein H8356DRAFT_948312, partial [Neocallimastix lanati (nom. inval.)]
MENFVQDQVTSSTKLNTETLDILIYAIDCANKNDTYSAEPIHLFLRHGFYPNLNYVKRGRHGPFKIPLFYAIAKSQFIIANLLMKYGANINYLY